MLYLCPATNGRRKGRYEPMATTTVTLKHKARCRTCDTVWQWDDSRRVRDVQCPRCRVPLQPTTYTAQPRNGVRTLPLARMAKS